MEKGPNWRTNEGCLKRSVDFSCWLVYTCMKIKYCPLTGLLSYSTSFYILHWNHGMYRPFSDILVAELVHGDGRVLRVRVTDVSIPVVFWNEVHIMEEETVPVLLLHGLPETSVHQLGSVKGVVSSLQSRQKCFMVTWRNKFKLNICVNEKHKLRCFHSKKEAQQTLTGQIFSHRKLCLH